MRSSSMLFQIFRVLYLINTSLMVVVHGRVKAHPLIIHLKIKLWLYSGCLIKERRAEFEKEPLENTLKEKQWDFSLSPKIIAILAYKYWRTFFHAYQYVAPFDGQLPIS
jgi:hypothetical protein